MIVYNYTSVKRREKRVYSLFNTTISQQGLSMNMIKVCGGVLLLFTALGLLFCAFTNKMWYSPLALAEGSSVGYFYMFFVLLPIVIGVILNSYKIQNYRAIDYIKLYIQPKKPLDIHGKPVKLTGFKVDSFVERL